MRQVKFVLYKYVWLQQCSLSTLIALASGDNYTGLKTNRSQQQGKRHAESISLGPNSVSHWHLSVVNILPPVTEVFLVLQYYFWKNEIQWCIEA